MKILAVDTSSQVCAVALLENNNVICENIIDNGKTHSENFMVLLDKTLEKNNLKLDDIDLFVCAIGPGSFTGIRIGIASVKAMAEIMNIPIVAVTSLESLAYNVENAENSLIIPMIDARNNQVYAGIFDENFKLCGKYMADDIENVLDIVTQVVDTQKIIKLFFVGNGSLIHKEKIKNKFKNIEINFMYEIDKKKDKQSGVSLGKCGYNKFIKNLDIESADTLKPLYLRKSQAERMKDDKK